jgi:PilZ domain
VRSRVHWPVLLFRNEGDGTVETTTQDLSSSGFYCLSKKPFAIGEMLTCALQVPNDHAGGRERRLECRVLVVRVDSPINGQYGIACRTQDYHFAGADAS